ncbi:O-antigen ligase family protein [Acetobacterium woodii]|nr:O-antigen ligase family protein [Acetobacterium woodii]
MIIKNKNSEISFKILCLFVAIYPITPDYFRIVGIPAQILVIIMCLGFLFFLNGFKYPLIKERRIKAVYTSTIVWAISMVLIYLIHGSTYAILSILLPWVILFPFLIKNINTKERILKVIDILVIAGFIVSILAIIDEVTGINVFWFLNNSGTDIYIHEARLGIRRVYSFSSHPNSFSLYCMFIEAILFYRIFCTSLQKKSFYKAAYVTVFIAACCTASRASIIAIIISQLIFLWMKGYKKFFKYLLYVMFSLCLLLFIIALVAPELYSEINSIFVLLMAVFNDSYAEQLQSLGYQWTANGVADRFTLWEIVFSKMKGHFLIGYGPSTLLEGVSVKNSLGVSNEKSSIEVQFLLLLYRYGIIVALIEEIRNMIQIFITYKNRRISCPWESKIGFNRMCCVTFLVYFLMLFTLNQTDTVRIYMILSSLFLAYNYNLLREVKN